MEKHIINIACGLQRTWLRATGHKVELEDDLFVLGFLVCIFVEGLIRGPLRSVSLFIDVSELRIRP